MKKEITEPETKRAIVEYIDKGTFQGGDEDCFLADFIEGQACIVISQENFAKFQSSDKAIKRLRELADRLAIVALGICGSRSDIKLQDQVFSELRPAAKELQSYLSTHPTQKAPNV